MSKAKRPPKDQNAAPQAPQAVDVVDGIPDRAARARGWYYALLAGAFLIWVAFLVYCQVAGKPG
jgi:hypothetical protein